jgi:hypothetical protein
MNVMTSITVTSETLRALQTFKWRLADAEFKATGRTRRRTNDELIRALVARETEKLPPSS